MESLSPGETFAIRRQLNDPSDSATYYIRAVLYWTDTDVVIPVNGAAYVNLTDRGGQLFRSNITVPGDKNAGSGSRMAIKTTVYTDSGYTTASDAYAINDTEYLVFDRRNPYQGLGGMGADINYDSLRKIVKEEVAGVKVKIPETDLAPILSALTTLKSAITDLKMPEVPDIPSLDLGPVLVAISQAKDAITGAVSGIKIPEPQKLDLSPLAELSDRVKAMDPDEYKGKMDEFFNRLKDFFGTDMDNLSSKIEAVMSFMKSINHLVLEPGKKDEPND